MSIMSGKPLTIPKYPEFKPGTDFYALKREGIELIIKLCSDIWTDFNTHDPGVTILEALCYAITDLTYRAGWDIRDILSVKDGHTENTRFYPGQPFFTARDIMTVNPVTPDDFRRVLIDCDSVRNAWMLCREGISEITDQACCDEEAGTAFKPPVEWLQQALSAKPLGLYNVLLELEEDPEAGDLNDSRIECRLSIDSIEFTVEFRFPRGVMPASDQWDTFIAGACADSATFTVELRGIGFNKTVKSEPVGDDDLDTNIRRNWRKLFYLDITVHDGVTDFDIDNITMRMYGGSEVKEVISASELKSLFDGTAGRAAIQKYAGKIQKREICVQSARAMLDEVRNLDEDYHDIGVVSTQDIAVCAEVEVRPDADIELVYSRILLSIEQYLNPAVPFYSMRELLDAGEPAEELFNGPALVNGFIKRGDLEAAGLKSVIYVSDIINRLMEIDGVVNVDNVQLTGYDDEGNALSGMADPVINSNGETVFDPMRVSASWIMYVISEHQPRLYLNGSDFMFHKNGLPFRARMDEVIDTLTRLRGETERPRFSGAPNDLPLPQGRCRNIDDYFPVQYSFPAVYCTGPDEMPKNASDEHRTQVLQLKAYMMVFEQILGNSFAQIAHAAELFSIDPGAERTYFVKEFSEKLIQGYDNISALSGDADAESKLHGLVESSDEYHDRRNRFLDHLLARFAEQFSEYTLLLSDLEGGLVASDRLVDYKRSFLNAYPVISHDRGRAFNYRGDLTSAENVSGISRRINLLLGSVSGHESRMIVVEHLLLRPKFPGDALYPVFNEYSDDTCCGDDPYSFRVTFVMPGWAEPYKTGMDIRSFAERTIRMDIPSHLLPKICWAGNDGLDEAASGRVTGELCMILEYYGKTDEGLQPSTADACMTAKELFSGCSDSFTEWYEGSELDYFHPEMIDNNLTVIFNGVIDNTDINGIVLSDNLRSMLLRSLLDYFRYSALYGMQFDRFENAWKKWLVAGSGIDWMKERLRERVEAVLAATLNPGLYTEQSRREKLVKCSSVILRNWGSVFYDWMETRLKEVSRFEEIDPDDMPLPDIYLCPAYNLDSDPANKIKVLLGNHYRKYIEVSYRLRVVVNLLAELRNIYPPATLHDWDEGNDTNPVRLGKTALGS